MRFFYFDHDVIPHFFICVDMTIYFTNRITELFFVHLVLSVIIFITVRHITAIVRDIV